MTGHEIRGQYAKWRTEFSGRLCHKFDTARLIEPQIFKISLLLLILPISRLLLSSWVSAIPEDRRRWLRLLRLRWRLNALAIGNILHYSNNFYGMIGNIYAYIKLS